jgi:hypothetical protein
MKFWKVDRRKIYAAKRNLLVQPKNKSKGHVPVIESSGTSDSDEPAGPSHKKFKIDFSHH